MMTTARNSLAGRSPAFGILRHSGWDAIPVGLELLHITGVILLVVQFHAMSIPAIIAAGLLYSVSISWNINSIAHNFIHNPYFRARWMNRGFSLLLSVTLGFSQTLYHYVHNWHHAGNMDRPDADGNTVDYLSIYRHGEGGLPESPWRYTLLSYFRDDLGEILRRVRARRPADARFAVFELAACLLFYAGLALIDWRCVLVMLPFYYIGHSLSSLNGYYEHFGADPDRPIAWGVSSYSRLYNWLWLNNGYHAEHHYRPKQHWTKMHALHREIADQQRAAGVRVIRYCHALGFLDPDLPRWRDVVAQDQK